MTLSVSQFPELQNFLWRSVEAGRWREALGVFLRSLRSGLAAWRGARRRQHLKPANWTGRVSLAPELPAPGSLPGGVQRLAEEASGQLAGIYRLAGGGFTALAITEAAKAADLEDQSAIHRLYWAYRYAVAAAFGHQRAFEGLARDWAAWRAADWSRYPAANAAYALSERIASLCQAAFWLRRLHTPEAETLEAAFHHQVAIDAGKLATCVEYELAVHNHLLNNARGLYLASETRPESREGREWRQLAFTLWEQFFPPLVLADGAFAEQSSHYHLLLARTALQYYVAAQKHGRALPEGFPDRLRAMFGLADELVRADGSLARFGDSSPDCTAADLEGLLAAAAHHRLLDHAPRNRTVTPLTIWFCGDAVLPAASESGAAPAAPAAARVYPQGGFAFLRGAAFEVAAHGDPRTEVRGHGDAGRGSYEVWRAGQVLIREPGCFLYARHPRFDWYRSGAGQNVTCVRGVAPGLTGSLTRQLPNWYWPAGGSWETAGPVIRFFCQGFRRLQDPVDLTRDWRMEQDGTLVFSEQIQSPIDDRPRVQISSYICLGDLNWKAETTAGAGGGIQTLTASTADGARVRIRFEIPQGGLLRLGRAGYVPEYGVERPALQLQLSTRAELPFRWGWRMETERTEGRG